MLEWVIHSMKVPCEIDSRLIKTVEDSADIVHDVRSVCELRENLWATSFGDGELG